jgi:hypothetical protein
MSTGTITSVKPAFPHFSERNGWIVEYDTIWNAYQVYVPGTTEPAIGDTIRVTRALGPKQIVNAIDLNGVRIQEEPR